MPKRKAGKALLDGFNPISEWEEQVEVEGLTLWDLNRPVWAIKGEAAAEDGAPGKAAGKGEAGNGSKDNLGTVDAATLHSDIKVRFFTRELGESLWPRRLGYGLLGC